MHTPLTQHTHTPVTQRSRSGLTMLLSKHSVVTYQETSSYTTRQGTQPQSSQLAEPLWTDPNLKTGINVRELISTLKKKRKKMQAWNESSNILPKSSQARKEPLPPSSSYPATVLRVTVPSVVSTTSSKVSPCSVDPWVVVKYARRYYRDVRVRFSFRSFVD